MFCWSSNILLLDSCWSSVGCLLVFFWYSVGRLLVFCFSFVGLLLLLLHLLVFKILRFNIYSNRSLLEMLSHPKNKSKSGLNLCNIAGN